MKIDLGKIDFRQKTYLQFCPYIAQIILDRFSTENRGLADIVLFGNFDDMENNHHVGTKYLWASAGGVLELHGKVKKSWTRLNEHIFRDSVPGKVKYTNA